METTGQHNHPATHNVLGLCRGVLNRPHTLPVAVDLWPVSGGDAQWGVHPHEEAVAVGQGVCGQGVGLILTGRPTALASPVQVTADDEDDKDDDQDEEDSAKGSTDDDGHQGAAV